MPGVAARWAAYERRLGSRSALGSFGGTPQTVTFPTTLLVTRVQVALGADLSADPSTWGWLDITEWVRHDQGISVQAGRRDEATQVYTGTATMKLDNRDGRFTRRNPTGPYYGLLSKNTPIWATVNAGSGEYTRLEMFVNEWPTRWTDKSALDSTVTITCAGILRRLGQGRRVRSPLRRSILADSPTAYWSLEDGAEATVAASAVAGGAPLTVRNFGPVPESAGPAGGLFAWSFAAGGALAGPVAVTAGTASSWEVEATAGLLAAYAGGDDIRTLLTVNTGLTSGLTSFGFSVSKSSGVMNWAWHYGFDNQHFFNSPLDSSSAIDLGGHAHLRLTVTMDDPIAGFTAGRFYIDGSLVQYVATAGTLYEPQSVQLNTFLSPYAPANVDSLSHVAVWSPARTSATTYAAVDGYAGERAHNRIARLCAQEGIAYSSLAAESAAMGPQGVGAVLDLIREAETAGGGVLYEKRWGLAYQSLRERYNAPVSLALDFDAGHIAETPEPADDDQRTRNLWTVSRPDGAEATVEQVDGPMGSAITGLYDDAAQVGVATDGQLASQAGWRGHLGTIDEDRWPRIELNFARSPDLIDAWCTLPFGARLTASNPPDQMPPDPIDAVIEGYTERWDTVSWRAALNTSPASAYEAYQVEASANRGRLDSANSTLAADATDAATTLTVTVPGVLWVTGAVDFDIDVAGERMTVSNISGASSPQTFTVTRSVNGVVKAQPATVGGVATRVRLWRGPVYGM